MELNAEFIQNPEVYMFLTTCERAGFYSQINFLSGFLFVIISMVVTMFERLLDLITNKELDKIGNAKILIVGLGGVGGYALEALIRSGFKNITLVDGDIINESNLNRQIIATHDNIGLSKVDEGANRALSINKSIIIKKINEYLTVDNFSIFINEPFDYIIDACDDIKIKIALIKYAKEKNINIITCLGTGKKFDPTKLEISKLNKTYNDPLAKKLRYELKKLNIDTNIPVVFSSEEIINNSNIIGSAIFVPASAGLLLANYVFMDIIKSSNNN